MRIAALQLVGGLLVKLVYVPSEDNPADAPSRGIVRRWRKRANCMARSKKQLAAAEVRRKIVQKEHLKQSRSQRHLKRAFDRVAALDAYLAAC